MLLKLKVCQTLFKILKVSELKPNHLSETFPILCECLNLRLAFTGKPTKKKKNGNERKNEKVEGGKEKELKRKLVSNFCILFYFLKE